MDDKKIVGRNLKALREANKYSQEQVASFLGIGRSCYSNYESGEREAPIEVLEKAAELMGCELNVLFEEDADVVENMLVCAFRAENLSDGDVAEVAAFKNIVMNYLKMKKLLAE